MANGLDCPYAPEARPAVPSAAAVFPVQARPGDAVEATAVVADPVPP